MRNYRGLICFLALLLAACSTPVPVQDRRDVPVSDLPLIPPVAPAVTAEEEEKLEELLELAGTAAPAAAGEAWLEAARLLQSMNESAEALSVLEQADLTELDLPLITDISLLKAELLWQNEQAQAALSALIVPALEQQLPQLDRQRRIAVLDLRATLLTANNEHLASLRDRVQLNRLLEPGRLQGNHELIWDNLQTIPLETLEFLAAEEINFEFQGWYELGKIGKSHQYNLDRQLVQLHNWQSSWSLHPAAANLPQELQVLQAIGAERPARIALLLPLNTNAGRVIRDAFMSAYMDVRAFGGQLPDIRFYDTSNVEDIMDLHRLARRDGAEMIIGPLLRQHVARLHRERDLGVPTLALNLIEDSRPASPLLYQFALSPEHETRQLAIRAWNDGHRFAAILSPREETGDDYYLRKRNSFIRQWQELGGSIVNQEFYQAPYTENIESLLGLNASEFRREQLSSLIGRNVEFVQRRRQDIDFIFLMAEPVAARQIKPRLGYLYAGDIPVYASQDIYSGIPRPLDDVDLNGVIFGDSPWLLGDGDDLKSLTQNLFPQNSALNLRLQAFAIDAFRLYPRLKQLESMDGVKIPGATGRLSLSPERHINRELSWARMEQGLAQPLDSGLNNPGS